MTTPHIAIDGRGALLYRGTGIGTYTWQLLAHLPQNLPRPEVFLPGQEYTGFRFDPEDIYSRGEQKDIWRREFLPRVIREKQIQLYHVPQNGIGLPEKKCCKETVTIHDLIPYLFPETVGRGYLKEFLKEMPKIMERSDAVITVSECSKKDIQRLFHYPEDRIHVIHEAPEPIYRPLPKDTVKTFLKEHYGICEDYILYVGGFGLRKNVKALINAYYLLKKEENIPYALVLPGKRNHDFDALDSLTEALQISDSVIFTDKVPTADLPYFYNGAAVMVYPSLYEGFGLPPLEAMACGTPVIAAKTSSLPEVLADNVLWFDPFDSTDLASQLYALLTKKELRQLLGAKGQKRTAQFQWKKAAAQTEKVFLSCLAE